MQNGIAGGVAGFLSAAAKGAKLGACLGPKGAFGGAVLAVTAYSAMAVVNYYW